MWVLYGIVLVTVAAWTGHCKKLAPAWKDLADHYRGDPQVNIAHVDCTSEKDICSANEVCLELDPVLSSRPMAVSDVWQYLPSH